MKAKVKNKYKDKDSLKEEIYMLSLENIDEAKDLYKKLTGGNISEGELKANFLTSNGEYAVECLKTINENLNTLLKLYSELNREEFEAGKNSGGQKMGKIYEYLDRVGATPAYSDNNVPTINEHPVIEEENGFKVEEEDDLESIELPILPDDENVSDSV